MKRSLSLRREALCELSTDELAAVAGGREHTLPQVECVTDVVERTIVILTPGPIFQHTQPCGS